MKASLLLLPLAATAALAQERPSVPMTGLGPQPPSGLVAPVPNSGAAIADFPFPLPHARGRYQPALALHYSSFAGLDVGGVGWSLTSSFITLQAAMPLGRDGLPAERFEIVQDGHRALLVPYPSAPSYRADVSVSYLGVTRQADGSWSALDGAGNLYHYTGPAKGPWYLDSVVDVDGNRTSYEYADDNGNRLLSAIRYNLYDAANPASTGSPSDYSRPQFANAVVLDYSPSDVPEMNGVAGIGLAEHTQLLTRVSVRRQDASSSSPLLRDLYAYQLSYSKSLITSRMLLRAIARLGRSGAQLLGLPTLFEYTETPLAGWQPTAVDLPPLANSSTTDLLHPTVAQCQHWFSGYVYNSAVGLCSPQDVAVWLDLDGDGLADLVWGDETGLVWARNLSRPEGGVSFAPVAAVPNSTGLMSENLPTAGQSAGGVLSAWSDLGSNQIAGAPGTTGPFPFSGTRILDVDGDGRPDLVGTSRACGPHALSIKLNTGAQGGFADPVCMDGSAAMPLWKQVTGSDVLQASWHEIGKKTLLRAALLDLTGDGVVDLVIVSGEAGSRAWTLFPGYRSASGWAFAPGLPPQLGPDGLDASVLVGAGAGVLARVNPTHDLDPWIEYTALGSSFLGSPSGSPTSGWLPVFRGPLAYTCRPFINTTLEDQPRSSFVDLNRNGRPTLINRYEGVGDDSCSNGDQFQILVPHGLDMAPPLFVSGLGPLLHSDDPKSFKYDAPDEVVYTRQADQSGEHNGPPPYNFNGAVVDVDGDGRPDYVAADADRKTWQWFRSQGPEAPPPDLLAAVHTPLGLTTAISYLPSSDFDVVPQARVFPVVRDVTTSGVALSPMVVRHWYRGLRVAPRWEEPLRAEQLGFAETWEEDDVTLQVRHTVWGTDHATRGAAVLVETGYAQEFRMVPSLAPPLLGVQHAVAHQPLAKSLPNQACRAAPSAADYPVVLFDAAQITTHTDSGVSVSGRQSVDCAAVDAYGNISAIAFDPDADTRGDESVRNAVFATWSLCPSCVLEEWAAGADGKDLYHRYYRYDAPAGGFDNPGRGYIASGHLNAIEEAIDGGATEIGERTAISANGNLAGRRVDYTGQRITHVETTLRYDSFQLDVISFSASDDGSSLTVDLKRDPATGLPLTRTGPYLPGGASAAPTVGYAYDDFNRLVAMARKEIIGSVVDQPIAAFDYSPFSTIPSIHLQVPAAISVQVFAASTSFTLGSIPKRDDVRLAIHYLDGMGRIVQTRRRMGTGFAAPPDASEVQFLQEDSMLVEGTVLLDGAGRIAAELEPYYAKGGLFADPRYARELSTPGLHALSRGYDFFGRETCEVYAPVAGQIVTAARYPDQCISDLAEGPGYRRAASLRYGARTDVGGRPYLTVEMTPPWQPNAPGPSPGPPSKRFFLDAQERVAYVQDAYGNTEQLSYDALGRTAGLARFPSPYGGVPSASTSWTYDLRGRVVREDDSASGRRLFSYLPSGELSSAVQAANEQYPMPPSGVEITIGSLGRPIQRTAFRMVRDPSCAWKRVEATDHFQYDAPYTTRPAAGPLGNGPGRLTAEWNDVATIAYGYTADGRLAERDEWFAGSDERHSVVRRFTNDGRPVWTTISSPALGNDVNFHAGYDSAGRLVRIDDAAGGILWQAGDLESTATGAYDTLGRIAAISEDFGHVTNTLQVAPMSNLPLGTRTASQSGGVETALFDVSAERFAADKMLGFTLRSPLDPLGGTVYSNAYDRDGRLTSATAAPAAPGSSAQQYREQYGFFADGNLAADRALAPSLWNRTIVRAGDSIATFAYRPEAPDRLAGITSPDGAALFEYDTRGRGMLIARVAAGERTDEYGYDAIGRLESITQGGTLLESLSYGPDGTIAVRSFDRAAPEPSRSYAGDDLTIAQRADGRIAYAHLTIDGVRIASVWFRAGIARGVIYYHRDRTGSVVATSRNVGGPGIAYRYLPYGAVDKVSGTEAPETASDLGFAGGLKLSGGLLHFGARDYSPALGRFLQPDALDPLRYTYVYGDPANFVDPSGLEGFDLEVIAPFPGGGFGLQIDVSFGFGGAAQQPMASILPAQAPIGPPGAIGQFVPFYGAGRSLINNVQTGHYGLATLDLGLFIGDFFLATKVIKLVGVGGKILLAGILVTVREGLVDLAAREGAGAAESFTARNFRRNLARLTGGVVEDAHAHHVFPKILEGPFESLGIHVHDPRFGAWWAAGEHLSKSYEYEQAWRLFLREARTQEEVFAFARQLAQQYGFALGF